jgi:hypothetical protein
VGLTLCAVWLGLLLTLLLLEFQVAVVRYSSCQLVDGHLLIISEAQDRNGILELERKYNSDELNSRLVCYRTLQFCVHSRTNGMDRIDWLLCFT